MTATCKHYLQVCPTCHDGTAPTEYTRTGSDVSMAVLFFDLTPRKQ